jgi:hypothetical protein
MAPLSKLRYALQKKRKLFKLFKLRDALMAVLSKLRYALQKK